VAEHAFLVTVMVDGYDEHAGLPEAVYARAALEAASLRAARSLEGFGGSGTADIADVAPA
jgi:hypothetical protein